MPSEVRPDLAAIEIEPTTGPTSEAEAYDGIAIDEVFPITAHDEWKTVEGARNRVNIPMDDFVVTFQYFKPQTIERHGRTVFRFSTNPGFGYWSNIVGRSRLLGSGSSQIYLNSIGPGGVCCTNYWITDISTKAPRSIFRSEDFGRFRNAMEIFDANGDGIYELVQFDSCMRYFRGDCGSCSPEPRVHFHYDREAKEYRPAKDIQQDFVKSQMANTEEWLEGKHSELKKTGDPRVNTDLRRSVIAHVADLLHIGAEKRAWQTFARYRGVVGEDDHREIKKRLAGCEFYQLLRQEN